MVRTRALRFLLILGLVALLIPVSLAQAQTGTGTAKISDAVVEVSLEDIAQADLSTLAASTVLHGAELNVNMTGVAAPAANTALEGWLVADDGGRKQSAGILNVDEDGNVSHTFKITDESGDPTGENLFGAFNKFVVTVEPVPDSDPEPSATIAYLTEIPVAAMRHIRHLTYAAGEGEGYAVALRSQLKAAVGSARQAYQAASNGDLDGAKDYANCAIGTINGSEECGDGMGVLARAASVVEHAGYAQNEAPENATIKASGDAAKDAAQAANESASRAARNAGLAVGADSSQVAAIHLNNVQNDLSAALGQAEIAYTSAQGMGAYSIAPLPTTGDPLLPQIARYGLIGGLALLILGSVMMLASRRRSNASMA